jgi:hypothetical protein
VLPILRHSSSLPSVVENHDHVFAARGALAEVARQAARVPGENSRELIRSAETLELSVLFELGEEGVS